MRAQRRSSHAPDIFDRVRPTASTIRGLGAQWRRSMLARLSAVFAAGNRHCSPGLLRAFSSRQVRLVVVSTVI
jgi:hypothetical protein